MLSSLPGRVPLDGSINYLISSPTLDIIGFSLHKALCVLLCRECGYASCPDDAPGHAHNVHKVSIKDLDVDAYAEYCSNNHVHADVHTVILPQPRGLPVQGVHYDGGLACIADPLTCYFCCHNEAHMVNHICAKHPNRGSKTSSYYAKVIVQTLFKGIGKKFFQVLPELAGVHTRDPFDLILCDFITNIPPPAVAPPDTERERTPFMKVVNWDKRMEEFRDPPSQRALILSLTSSPDSSEPHLLRLLDAMEEYIRYGMRIATSDPQSLTVRKHLRHGETIPTK